MVLSSLGDTAHAAEGGNSHYLPGAVGDIFLAVPPEPGTQIANVVWFQSGSIGTALIEGQVGLDLDVDTFINLTSLTYTFKEPVLGGRYTVGVAIPFGYSELEGAVTGPLGRRLTFDDGSFDLSDIAITPIQLNWSTGPWSFKSPQSIIAPTGGFSTPGGDLVNLGRNYWNFDTVGAATWFNPASGREFSFAAGVMFNTENSDTDYQTGTEFHLDAVFNQFVSESLAIGLRGYVYEQLTGDSGSGATLGNFKSSSYGIGPGFVWIPKSAGGQLTILGKWMHDIDADNRFESDYANLTAAWSF
jgi:hypothetical protein